MTLVAQSRTAIERLFTMAEKDEWRGWDPYDALASAWVRLFTFSLPLGRIFWIQLLKRSPINLRPLFAVPKLENPKALALFASAAWQLSTTDAHYKELGLGLLERLLERRLVSSKGVAWGYPFDWQSRAFYAPRQTPNVIVTTFIGHAFLDGYEKTKTSVYLDTAAQACEFILGDLNQTKGASGICFSYTPIDRSRIHNANLLAASFLARTGACSGNKRYTDAGLTAARYTLSKQAPDGSWPYGEAKNQQWVDSFHTGFNLVALDIILRQQEDLDMRDALNRGLTYYLNHFFAEDGMPRYYADKTWPIDIHSAAQAILTFSTLGQNRPELLKQGEKVLAWSLRNLYDERMGRFLFQKGRWFSNSTPFLRWSDAWMTRALAGYISSAAEVPHVSYAAS